MRGLIAMGLTICVAGSAAAQTEVIIRRPGQQDQVIQLDSAHAKVALENAQLELKKMAADMQQRLKEIDMEPRRLNTLALKNAELSAENFFAPMMPMIKRLADTLRRPHLGVVVDQGPRETDKYGAYIQAVTPGAPADKAGIVAGDIITKVAGKSLTEKDPKDDSTPGVRLISIISTLAVGKPVNVELRRGTENKIVKVTPDASVFLPEPSMAQMISRLPVDRLNQVMTFGGGEMPARAAAPSTKAFSIFNPENGSFRYSFGDNGLFASYELAPLNEKLGAYFGTTEGVLVVNTGPGNTFVDAAPSSPANPRAGTMTCDTTTGTTMRCHGGNGSISVTTYSEGVPAQAYLRKTPPLNLGLEPGDVIVSVDGRKVTNPSQLMKIVGSYDHNDEFKLQIMRQKHAETLTVKLP
jgi:membrane-associated protease RseP (regulator of RpoE activity)